MLKINENPVFTHKISVILGGEEIGTFNATFCVRTITDFNAIDHQDPEGVSQFLRETVTNCDDLATEDGKPVKYDAAVFDRLIDQPHIRRALWAGYLEGLAGAVKGN